MDKAEQYVRQIATEVLQHYTEVQWVDTWVIMVIVKISLIPHHSSLMRPLLIAGWTVLLSKVLLSSDPLQVNVTILMNTNKWTFKEHSPHLFGHYNSIWNFENYFYKLIIAQLDVHHYLKAYPNHKTCYKTTLDLIFFLETQDTNFLH